MRFALFVPTLQSGGAERVMVTVANELSTRHADVDLVFGGREAPLLKFVAPRVNKVRLEAGRLAAAIAPLTRYVRTSRPAAMLSTIGHANAAAIMVRAAAAPRMRLVVREASTPSAMLSASPALKEQIALRLFPRMYRFADAVIAPSEGVADDLRRFVPDGCAMHVIPNPISRGELDQLADDVPEHPWLREDAPPVIAAVGRLTPAKDYESLLRAFALVREQRSARLLVLGEGEERERLERMRRELCLEDCVDLHGHDENPFKFIRRSRVFVLSSRSEGMPNSLLQAVALGAPVVSTDCQSGPREILDDGRWGYLVAVSDAPAMARAILSALDRPKPSMPSDLFDRQFGVAAVVDRYLAIMANT